MISADDNSRERIFEKLFRSISDIGEPGAAAMEQARLAHHHCCGLEATVGYLLTVLMTDDGSRRHALEKLLSSNSAGDTQIAPAQPPKRLPASGFR